jgi:hypothetical protein
VEGFNLKRLNEVNGKEQYCDGMLEILGSEVDINTAWETIKENIKFQSKRVKVFMN